MHPLVAGWVVGAGARAAGKETAVAGAAGTEEEVGAGWAAAAGGAGALGRRRRDVLVLYWPHERQIDSSCS